MTSVRRRHPWAARWGFALLILAACGPASDAPAGGAAQAPEPSSPAVTEAAVDSTLDAFLEAQRSLDTTAAMAHMWPEFSMLQDGQRASYEEVLRQIRATFPGLQTFTAEWTDVQVQALSPTLAITSFHFRDSIVTRGGEMIRSQGPTTLVWERRGPEWRILFADADHYPVGEPPP